MFVTIGGLRGQMSPTTCICRYKMVQSHESFDSENEFMTKRVFCDDSG